MALTNGRTVLLVTRNTLIAGSLLSAFKLFAGISAHSAAMLSDAVHSLSDVFGEIIVIAGVKMAGRESDKDHPYGHERLECVAAIILSFVLFSIGAAIGWSGVRKITGVSAPPSAPGFLALAAAAVSIIVKEAMFQYAHAAAGRTDSVALEASAWHHRSDAMSSIGSFAGILGARLGYPVFDPAAGVIISLFILKAAVDIFRDAVSRMTDRACADDVIAGLRAVVLSQAGVRSADQVKTRLFGDKIYVDVEISVDGAMPLNLAHDTAQRVHDVIESQFPKVKHCMVHVNPAKTGKEERRQ